MAKAGSKSSQANGASETEDFTAYYTDFNRMAQEVGKMFSSGQMFNTESLMTSQRKLAQAFTAANQVAWEGMQAVMRRQVEIARQAADDMARVAKDLTSAGTPEDKLAKQAEAMKTTFESCVANVRELSELMQKSSNEAVDVLSECVCDNLDHICKSAKSQS